MGETDIISVNKIQKKIYTFRNLQVMLDEDLAELYEVETKRLNEQVKRNIDRFPEKFMFQLSNDEMENLKSQIATSSWGGRRSNFYVFTEQGVAMLSGILRSDTAVKISIQIIDAFVAMRKFLSENGQLFKQLDKIEKRQVDFELKTDEKFNKVFDAIEESEITPKKGIFFDGQIYDAYNFINKVIKSAKKSIIIIDNYIDDTVLTQLTKKKKNVNVVIYTYKITKQLTLDMERFNKQYPKLEIKELKKSHDRFIIIDDKTVYHVGASLKDLGKKWFGFSKFDKEALGLIEKLGAPPGPLKGENDG